ncbi:HlyD family type I secretion periplasmic adaptor subunit [Allorhizobium sp. BGMRC 0089]|uniref:HlyD family type I secretion periplasmic adaptor subunit n=1 Tax=Allorhizobium sonneratiae TaxID=2934936 RepID=UPI002033B564|nr:HlyD family type I secretion periplasmic adaptor subunit [Allorhizobium sonneratiae]MCM2290772.1 HlyD family type I secretion periplasmic adaptor subunit [Allorhizobium sonneratiae]
MTKTLTLSPDEHRYAVRTTAEFLSESATILHRAPPRSARLTILTVAAMIVAAILISALMPIERVVSARGQVSSVAPHIVVQPIETSIVRQILVHDGQEVTAGEVLATLDPTFSRADQTSLSRQVASLTAEVARLKAEIDGHDYVPIPNDSFGQLQRRFFEARRQQYQASMANYQAKIASLETTQAQMQAELDVNRKRLALSEEGEAMKDKLVQQKFASRADALKSKDQTLSVTAQIKELEGKLASGAHDIDSVTAQMHDQMQQWRSDAMGQLVKQQVQLNGAIEELAKADKRHDLIELRAPEDATVLEIGDFSIGSVVQTAQKMFILVPKSSQMEVEAKISTQDQGFLHVGQDVDIKLDAWPFARYGGLKGKVRSISQDSLNTGRDETARNSDQSGASGQPYYIARITIVDRKLKVTPPDFKLMAGMTLTADVVVGDRTIGSYLFDRVVPVMTEGMREP